MNDAQEHRTEQSEERFRLLVDSVNDYAIFMLDPEGRITSWNRGAERIKGYTAREAIGRHFSDFYVPEDVAAGKHARALATALREGRYEDEGWRVRKDGTRFWANVVISAVRDAAGRHLGFAKVTRDMTDRNYRAFVEATNAIVWSTDENGHPKVDSPTWRAFTGQTEDEWLGRRAWAPVHADDRDALERGWREAKARQTTFEAEFRLRRRDGEYVWMGCRAIPLRDAGGALREWFGVTFDISARKRAELERAEALEREKAARVAAERAEARWTTTLRSIGDAVVATDDDGHIAFMNPVAEELTGWPLGEALGRPLVQVFPIVNEETRERVESPVDKVLREGKIVGLANHTILVRRDGADVAIDDSAAPIRDAAGALLGVVLVFRDVTAGKREEARRSFLARAGDALASSADYRDTLATVVQLAVPKLADWCAIDVLEADAPGTRQLAVAHVDPAKVAYARELGRRYPPDPNATSGVPHVIRTGKSELYPVIPQELLEQGAVDEEHLRIIKNLQLRSAMVVPLRGRDRVFGAITFVYAESGRAYSDDDLAFAEELARRAAIVIERRRLEEERETLLERERAARAEAELANRAKDEFLATVSHELRTPLNAIMGWAVTLRRKQVAPDVERILTIIERNARAQARLIEDVLDVSRIISGKLRLELGPADVEEAVAAAVESVRPAADAKAIAIDVDIEQGLEPILADASRLQQIVWNLASNAVKFTPKGGRVEVRAAREGSMLRILVRDTGAGIAPAMLRAVFEPFRQVDASTTRQHGGLGLGLAIVRQLVQAHGGAVRAESAGEGRGATFTVELPARTGAPLKRRPTSTPPKARPSLAGLSVLVVDDEPDARDLVTELLSEAGARVVAAASADEAVARFEAARPDVLISDIGMPHADGYTLLRRIRSLPPDKGGRTPAVALTAYARGDDADRAFGAGFQMHLAKPVDPDELVAVVANLGGVLLEG